MTLWTLAALVWLVPPASSTWRRWRRGVLPNRDAVVEASMSVAVAMFVLTLGFGAPLPVLFLVLALVVGLVGVYTYLTQRYVKDAQRELDEFMARHPPVDGH